MHLCTIVGVPSYVDRFIKKIKQSKRNRGRNGVIEIEKKTYTVNKTNIQIVVREYKHLLDNHGDKSHEQSD